MKIRQWIAVASGVALSAGAAVAIAQTAGSAATTALPGLVKVSSKHFDEVLLQPGADFRGYTKVLLHPTQIAFAANWVKDMNSPRIALLRRTTVEDAERIAAEVRTGFADVFAHAFERARYEIVAAPGPDVLVLSPRLIEVFINAPRTVTLSLPSRVYTLNAGEATLVLEIRDSTTGALLGRIVDRRTAGERGGYRSSLMLTSPVSNRLDFGWLFDTWAQGYITSLQELKAQSPVARPAG